MAERPAVFDQAAFQSSLRRQQCPESFVAPITSDFRLFVPLVLADLGQERLFAIVEAARPEYGLGEQEAAWRVACKHIVGWAEECLADYKSGRP